MDFLKSCVALLCVWCCVVLWCVLCCCVVLCCVVLCYVGLCRVVLCCVVCVCVIGSLRRRSREFERQAHTPTQPRQASENFGHKECLKTTTTRSSQQSIRCAIALMTRLYTLGMETKAACEGDVTPLRHAPDLTKSQQAIHSIAISNQIEPKKTENTKSSSQPDRTKAENTENTILSTLRPANSPPLEEKRNKASVPIPPTRVCPRPAPTAHSDTLLPSHRPDTQYVLGEASVSATITQSK